MKIKQTAAMLLATIVMVISSTPQKTSAAAPDTKGYGDQVIMLVNQERAAAGLEPLYAAPVLNTLAEQRANELVQSFSHERPDGSSFSTILSDIYWSKTGENIAYNYKSPSEVMGGWMNSTGHRNNILKPEYNYIGVGVVYANNQYYWSQIFIAGSNMEGAYLPTDSTGDVNGDGTIDSADAALILTAAARLGANQGSGLDASQQKAADVNHDNVIDAYDASLILQYSALAGVLNTVTLDEVVSGKFG